MQERSNGEAGRIHQSLSHHSPEPLLTPGDGPPVEVINRDGKSQVVLVCEHASNRVPENLNNLGLTEEQLNSHVGWDPGALDLAKALSVSLDSPLIAARLSRLVYDCNRPPEATSAMPDFTEVCRVPGNVSLSEVDRQARAREIYEPFHVELAHVIARKRLQGLAPVLVTIHSFTPVFRGEHRFVEVGYLHGQDNRLAKAMLLHASSDQVFDIRLNQPYGPEDGVLHTIDRHTAKNGAANVMVEIRNDLLANNDDRRAVHELLLESLGKALDHLNKPSKPIKTGTA
ncbi:N-formylglutamate amidohydrolase [Hoeflea sp. TYP-13]|uniref:N-formylglutamate amidohydrolase n=1 Tax=Hoeflea sp. TYP-13 TaxID=3230023 RepID=UPI0034C60577